MITIDYRGVRVGDSLIGEPIVRFARDNYYPDLHLLTDHPDLFSHLDIPINPKKFHPFLVSPNSWKMGEDGNWIQHPFATFVQIGRIHIQEYMSLFVLRQFLTDEYRPIQTPVTKTHQDYLLSKYPFIKDCWIIHPGFGEAQKSHGKEYWNSIAAKLRSRGLKLLRVGKTYSAQGLSFGSYDIESDFDLTDKLSLIEFLTAISVCKGVITNESSPVIMAGAFNKKLVSIFTAGHPDFLLPHRSTGSKHDDAICLWGKKHYMMERNYAPHNNIDFYVDGSIPVVESIHLPTPDKVVESVFELELKD